MAASSSSAAPDSRPPKYDVFISFRGEDTRKGFISHLYSALSGKQIEAYIDEVSLEKGDTISRALPEAIKESEISIIVFSKNYGESRWCLDELVHILKRREEKDQIVLPIFYNIDPSYIQNQKETYAAAFVKHEERFEMEKVQKWRQALKDAATISGWDSRNMSESKILEEVVERVKRELDTIMSKRSDVWNGLLGIPKRLEKIKSYLDSPAVRVGIWGMGGIGKTTLAIAAFDRFHNDYEGSYLAHDVRENAISKGLNTLKKEVYSELLGDKQLDTSPSAVNHKLSRKRILLVLDDVENPMQFEDLVGDPYRFCPGSKIIVTSRHKLKVDEEYKVEVLDSDDACKLFYLKAFGHESCRSRFEEITGRVVKYTKGHPLALKVLGASVFCFLESIENWGKELEKLERIPNDDIRKVLERSYHALDAEQKGLFLDIACFFKGQQRDFVEGILEDKPISGLVNKSLITIEDGRICMHDLMEEMGRNIVYQSTHILGERSRLWIFKDVFFVLDNNRGTEATEGISFPCIDRVVRLRPDVFEKMCNLRLLKIYNARQDVHSRPYRKVEVKDKVKVYINGDLKYLPNGLRYLHWEDYPGKSLPSNFKPHNLVELHMPNSNLKQLWDGVQELRSLKHINLHESSGLTKIPDLSQAPKLESINLCGCKKLSSFPKLPRNIEVLELGRSGIEQIPSSLIECLSSLRILSLTECSLASKFIPKTLCKLTRLQELDLSFCSQLESFPMLSGLCSLTHLYLSGCNIREIPDWLGSLTSLTELKLRQNSFDRIPASIGMLYNLKKLDISDCYDLRSLPELPLFIESVNTQCCLSLEMVSTLRSTLTMGRWLDKYDGDGGKIYTQREFSFERCTKLGEDAINNIFREFLYKVFCTATTPTEVVVSKRVIAKVVVCYPTTEILESLKFGNEYEGYPNPRYTPPISHIPRWFNYQSEGSSMTIELPTNWYNPKTFLGFVISVIVIQGEVKSGGPDGVECILHLMTDGDRFRVDEDYGYKCGYITLDHIVMWYNYFDHSKINFEKEYIAASFEFESRNLKVKRCGVRMLYLRDAVEKFNDGTTANFESWTIEKSDGGTTANFESWTIEKSDGGTTANFESRTIEKSDDDTPRNFESRTIEKSDDDTPGNFEARTIEKSDDDTPGNFESRTIEKSDDDTPGNFELKTIEKSDDDTPGNFESRTIEKSDDGTTVRFQKVVKHFFKKLTCSCICTSIISKPS